MVIPQSSTEIERLLMRWPFSAHLKYELRKARIREERQRKRARAKLLRTIKGRLKCASIEILREISDQLRPEVSEQSLSAM